jgi:hypothetical protein
MSKLEQQIAQTIKHIADNRQKAGGVIMSGTVVAGSTNTDAQTVSVVLSINDETNPSTDIMLNAVTLNMNGLILYPADNSNVWVTEVDGSGKYGVIKCSDVVKAIVTINGVVFEMDERQVQVTQDNAVMTMSGGKFSIKNDSQDFKTLMDTHFSNLAQMTFTNGAGTTGPANNVAALNTDKSSFDTLFY